MSQNFHPLKKILSLLVGCFIMAVCTNAYLIPNKMLSGGLTGIAILLELLLGIQTHYWLVILNIPLFILAYILINKRFVNYSLLGLLSFIFFLYATKSIQIHYDDLLVTAIVSGFFNGIGAGLIFRYNSSAGGSDILAKIINKYFSYGIGLLIFAFNFIVVSLSAYFFGVKLAVYTLISMFITSYITQIFIEGLNYKRAVFIISDDYTLIAKEIIHHLQRGVTVLDGKGAYSNHPKHMLYCVVSIREISKLKLIVKHIDQDAFITVTQTSFVIGNGKGFLNINSED